MLVHTHRGLVPAADLAEGDTAFCLDDRTREIRPGIVISARPGDDREVVAITLGTRELRATVDTRVLVLVDRRRPGRLRRRFKEEWVPIGDLNVGDIVGVARKTPDVGTVQELPLPTATHDRRARAVTFPQHASADLMWWSGLYIGDGFIAHAGHRRCVEFAIPASQPDLRKELLRASHDLFGIVGHAPDEWRVSIPGIRLSDYVEAIGLGGKALEKRVPGWVFASPEAQRLAFLGGYIDADGLVRAAPASKDMGATSANAALLEDVRRLAVTCGIRTSRIWAFTSRHPRDSTRTMIGYRMQFSGDFDRVSCRASQRRDRMNKRRWFHKDLAPAGTTLRAHTSEWLGFAKLRQIDRPRLAHTYAIAIQGSANVLAERLIVAAPEAGTP